MDITCNDGRRSDSNVFFVNVLRNQPPVFVNLQSTHEIFTVKPVETEPLSDFKIGLFRQVFG